MTAADQPAVLEVARTLATWFHPVDQMALALDLKEHEGFIALDGGEVVGFLTYHFLSDKAAELSWFGVLPGRQGQGIGRYLLAQLESTLLVRGGETLELSTVPADHEPAFIPTNAFYERHGFTVQQRDDHFYAFGRPRVLFRKRLMSR